MFSLLFFSIFSPLNLVPSKHLSTLLLMVVPGADPGSVGSLTSRQPSWAEGLGLLWGMKGLLGV